MHKSEYHDSLRIRTCYSAPTAIHIQLGYVPHPALPYTLARTSCSSLHSPDILRVLKALHLLLDVGMLGMDSLKCLASIGTEIKA